MRFCFFQIALVCLLAEVSSGVQGVAKVSATATELRVDIEGTSSSVVELEPFQTSLSIHDRPTQVFRLRKWQKTVAIPRFDGPRDRLYSGFLAMEKGEGIGPVRFVEGWEGVAKNPDPYPQSKSKKGLQVQMVDDAIALGVKHAGLNIDLGSMAVLTPASNDFAWPMDGRTFHFRRRLIERVDETVKALSDSGATMTLILLNCEGRDPELNKILLHPNYDRTCQEHLSAFNTATPEGLAWFKASIEFLADRYSAPGYPHGRVANYIVGNEIDSHWIWSNMGHVSMEQFALDYSRTVRVCNTAVRKFSASARVFISLDHHWNIRSAALDATQGFEGRRFVDCFNRVGKAGGDFDWHLAFHPYPENPLDCRTWNDRSATLRDDTPRITFKNIEMLPRYLRRPEMRLQHNSPVPARSKIEAASRSSGQPRRIILSEQGFHSNPTPESEQAQAAAYCYAWHKIARMNGIDSFILHRHVDHALEGGWNVGLWRRNPASSQASEPLSKKPIYEVFRAADTPEWEKAFEFALPIIGLKSWTDLDNCR